MSQTSERKIAVLGAGSWGTALAAHLARARGASVALWGNDPDVVHELESAGTNSRYFPGESPCTSIAPTLEIAAACRDASLVVVAVPSFAVRDVSMAMSPHVSNDALVVSAGKGLEGGSLLFLSDVIAQSVGSPSRIAVLSGPSFALEVLRGQPTAVTIAARDELAAQRAAAAFHSNSFRVYTTADVIGVEVGGAVKNVIALAVGMVDGLKVGTNARAALITRGLAEIARLSEALGGDLRTISGLSGLGDLLLTATGDLSRNRNVGLRLGQGENLDAILTSLGQVAEGVEVAPKILALANRHGVAMPITEEIVHVLSGRRTVAESARALLARERRGE